MPKKTLLRGALILTAAGVICRALGVLFRIPFANIVGNYGIGLYQMVFPLYSLLLIISSAGIPVAISKIIARVRDDHAQCRKIFFNALMALLVIGTVVSVGLAGLACPLATWQGKPEIWPLYVAIAPAVGLVCVISALRGYFQGLNNMVPTAVSQIVEQVVKVALALGLAVWWVRQSVLWAVLGSIVAVSVSELIATIVLIVIYRVKVRRQPRATIKGKLFDWTVIKQIFVMAAPIMVMSLAFPVVQLFDSFFVVNALKSNGVTNATELYGIASGAVHTLINLPTVVGIALATVLLPMVARNYQKQQFATIKRQARPMLWLAFGFGLVVAVVYFALAPWILNLLYHNAFRGRPEELAVAVRLLRVECWAVILIGLTQVISSILQGLDRARYPMWALIMGGIAKVVFEIVGIKALGVMAVSIANVLCFGIALMVDGLILIKLMRQRK